MKIAIVSRSGSALQDIIKHLALAHLKCEPTLISLEITFHQRLGIAKILKRRMSFTSLFYFVTIKYLENRSALRYIKFHKIVRSDSELSFSADSNLLLEFLSSEKFDLLVLGQNIVLPKEVLDAGLNRFVNVHPARLPKYRGYAEPAHAILAGKDQDIGYSLHIVSPQMDQGSLIDFVQVDLRDTDSLNESLVRVRISGYDELFRRIAIEGVSSFLNRARPQSQNEASSVDILPYKKRLALDLQIFRRRVKRKLEKKSLNSILDEK